jgi:hypothetical protein
MNHQSLRQHWETYSGLLPLYRAAVTGAKEWVKSNPLDTSVKTLNALLAAAVLAGILLGSLAGWWADPVALVVIVYYAVLAWPSSATITDHLYRIFSRHSGGRVSRWGTGLWAADSAGGARLVRASQVGLNRADDRGEDSGREKSWPQRTGGILSQRRQAPKRGPGFGAHVFELPVDLVVDRPGPIRRRQTGRFRGIRGCPQGVRSHVCDGCGLSGRPGGSHSSRAIYLACGTASNKPPPDLFGGTELTAGEGPGSGDGVPGASICRCLCLK